MVNAIWILYPVRYWQMSGWSNRFGNLSIFWLLSRMAPGQLVYDSFINFCRVGEGTDKSLSRFYFWYIVSYTLPIPKLLQYRDGKQFSVLSDLINAPSYFLVHNILVMETSPHMCRQVVYFPLIEICAFNLLGRNRLLVVLCFNKLLSLGSVME